MTSAIVTLRFTSKGHFGSRIAAFLAQSRDFNHVMLIDGEMAYEAVTSGVRCVPLEVSMSGVVRYQDMTIRVRSAKAMRAFARAQLGKKYDWLGAIGLPILRADSWQSDNRWWCSEYVAATLGAGDTWLLDPEETRRVTPNDLHQTNNLKSPLIHL